MASSQGPGSPSSLTSPNSLSTPEPTDLNSDPEDDLPPENSDVHYNAYGFLLDKLSNTKYTLNTYPLYTTTISFKIKYHIIYNIQNI